MKKTEWQEDIEQLKTELPKLHKNFFYAANEIEFYSKIDHLQHKLNRLDTYKIVMELARIVATAKDAHTAVMLPQSERLPFDCYAFSEGIFITAADEENSELLYTKIIKVEGYEIDTICQRLTEIISHENMQFVLHALPDFLICADILYGTGVITKTEKVTITVQNSVGETFERTVKPIQYCDYKIKKPEINHLPLYRQNAYDFYWSSFDGGILYINYNKCKDMKSISVAEFCESLKSQIMSNKKIEKTVIDLRNNTGGNSELFRPFLVWLSNNKNVNQKGKLYVIVGRDTFSSALLNVYFLKFNTKAIFIGEPTGGKPNCYGEVQYLELKNSGLYIRYSTKYYYLIENDDELSFVPSHLCEVSFEDYINGIDRCMAELSLY